MCAAKASEKQSGRRGRRSPDPREGTGAPPTPPTETKFKSVQTKPRYIQSTRGKNTKKHTQNKRQEHRPRVVLVYCLVCFVLSCVRSTDSPSVAPQPPTYAPRSTVYTGRASATATATATAAAAAAAAIPRRTDPGPLLCCPCCPPTPSSPLCALLPFVLRTRSPSRAAAATRASRRPTNANHALEGAREREKGVEKRRARNTPTDRPHTKRG
jgi:hypothetical protein